MAQFFDPTATADEQLYRDIIKGSNRYVRRARRMTERMWKCCGQFLEADAPVRARKHDFQSVWWELYLAYALAQSGVSLVPRSARRVTAGRGKPDLLASNPRVWIEAVMPQAGTGVDALSESTSQGVFDIPADRFVLRLATAVQEKSAKLIHYIDNGTIARSDATVIAISGGRLPFRFQDYPVPNIVRALCGVGFLGIELDVQSVQRVGTHVDFRDHIEKKSKSPVSTDLFLQLESAHISAVLYSCADCVNYPRKPGAEFILVHNPNASVPLPIGWLSVGEHHWLEKGALRREAAQTGAV